MPHLEPLKEEHYRDLFEVIKVAEPHGEPYIFEEVANALMEREGFVVVNTDGVVVGAVTYGNFVPTVDIILHATVLPEYHGRWITRAILKQIFGYPFIELELPRLSGISISGLTDKGGEILERLGFLIEGRRRRVVKIGANYHDLILYGMLREDCRWLR